jgi:hypothetical protein
MFFANNSAGFGFTGGGPVFIGTSTDSGALLQVGANAATGAALAGMSFGGDISLSRSAGDSLEFSVVAGTPTFKFMNGAVFRGFVGTNGATTTINSQSGNVQLVSNNTVALTCDASQRTILSGALRLANAYVAGAVVGTGYVTIQDSTGTTYRVPVLV